MSNPGKAQFEMEKVLSLGSPYEVAVSPDGCHLACVTRFLKVAGRGPDFWFIAEWDNRHVSTVFLDFARQSFTFSPDSGHLAFIAATEKGWMVVRDAKVGEPFPAIPAETTPLGLQIARVFAAQFQRAIGLTSLDPEALEKYFGVAFRQKNLVWSPMSDRLAYVAATAAGELVVLDGVPQKTYKWVGNLAFSPDGNHFAYLASPDTLFTYVVVDGRDEGPYLAASPVVFSETGGHWGYVAVLPTMTRPFTDQEWAVFVDGNRVSKKHAAVIPGSLVLNHDGSNWAYIVQNRRSRVVFRDHESDPGPGIVPGSIRFSPDGKHHAYIAARWEEDEGRELYEVVHDGRRSLEYSRVYRETLRFSADSSRLAYVAETYHSPPKMEVVVTPDYRRRWENVDKQGIIFSPVGSRFAYGGTLENERQRAVVDGIEGPVWDGVGHQGVVFSPNAEHWAYVAMDGHEQFVVLDGVPQERFDGIFEKGPVFSPDGTRLAYGARRGDRWFVVLDGKPGPEFDNLLKNCPAFRDNRTIEYLGLRDEQVFRVTQW
jgi:hypothetical protein